MLLKVTQRAPPNQAVQLTPLARLLGWARFTRQSAPACWQRDHPQPSDVAGSPAFLALQGSAARALPGSYLVPASYSLPTPASGAADSCTLGRKLLSSRKQNVIE